MDSRESRIRKVGKDHLAMRIGRRWRRAAIALGAVAAVLIPVTAAHADWYMTKRGAERATKDYVSDYYANTYAQDLTASCRPSGQRYDARYVYHRWVCGWYDRSDDTSGTVLIVGSRTPGAYYGKVLHGAR
jgi:hypothetical protein